MKNLEKIGMAFLALVLSVNLTACGDNDDETDNNRPDGGKDTKQLVEVRMVEGSDNDVVTAKFTYDEFRKLSRFDIKSEYNGDTNTESGTFEWGITTLINTLEEGRVTYSMANNLIVSSQENWNGSYDEEGKRMYSYDTNRRISSSTIMYPNETIKTNFHWDGDRLTSCDIETKYYESIEKESVKVEYKDERCKGFFPLMGFYTVDDDFDIMMVHPELFGSYTTALPSRIIDNYGAPQYMSITEFLYKFDQSGYVISCEVTTTDNNIETGEVIDKYVDLFQFKWQ